MFLLFQLYLVGGLLVKYSFGNYPSRNVTAEFSKADAFLFAKSQSLDISSNPEKCQLPNDGNILII